MAAVAAVSLGLTGAAVAGVLANLLGLAHGFDATHVARAAGWLYAAFAPVAGLGCIAALRTGAKRADPL